MLRIECRTTTPVRKVADDYGQIAVAIGDVKFTGPLIAEKLEEAAAIVRGHQLGEVLDDEWFPGRDYTACEGSGERVGVVSSITEVWCDMCQTWQPRDEGRISDHVRRVERVPS